MKGFIDPKEVVPVEASKQGVPKKFARGAFGSLYLAKYKGRDVVVKVLHEDLAGDPDVCKHFLRELELSMSFKHPYICRVYGGWDILDHDEGIYPSIVMEYLPLKLIDVLNRPEKHGLTPAIKQRIVYQLAMCLMNLHTRNPPVYHCDLKPENIMLTADLTVKLIDFGIAKIERNTLLSTVKGTTTAGIRGTVGYMVCHFLASSDDVLMLHCRRPRCTRARSTRARMCLRWA